MKVCQYYEWIIQFKFFRCQESTVGPYCTFLRKNIYKIIINGLVIADVTSFLVEKCEIT